MEFKEILKTRRLELGLTLDDIARYVGVSGATVSRWENGDIENIRRDKIAKLAEVLKVTPSYLMGWPEPQTASDESTPPLSGTYLRLARGAQELGLDDADVDAILALYSAHKKRNE